MVHYLKYIVYSRECHDIEAFLGLDCTVYFLKLFIKSNFKTFSKSAPISFKIVMIGKQVWLKSFMLFKTILVEKLRKLYIVFI